MIMVTTARTQNRYDHRLRELVRTTLDVSYAVQCGVPRSAARGWLNAPSVEVVTLDSLDLDATQLQREVLRLHARIRKLIVVLSATTFGTFLLEFSPPAIPPQG